MEVLGLVPPEDVPGFAVGVREPVPTVPLPLSPPHPLRVKVVAARKTNVTIKNFRMPTLLKNEKTKEYADKLKGVIEDRAHGQLTFVLSLQIDVDPVC